MKTNDQMQASSDNYEGILKFLDIGIRVTKAELLATHDLKKKIILSREITNLKETRKQLWTLQYVYEDYIRTGHYIMPAIHTSGLCELCGK